MDPPTSSSTNVASSNVDVIGSASKCRVKNSSSTKNSPSDNALPETAADEKSQRGILSSSHRRSWRSAAAVQKASMPGADQRHERLTRNAAKIIKGEIHNVLTVMRSDPRYYSTGDHPRQKRHNRSGGSRFEYEERSRGGRSIWGTSGVAVAGVPPPRRGTIFSSHPILQGLRELHDVLSVMGVAVVSGESAVDHHSPMINAITFVSPFTRAVCSKDVDAKTTGAALSALHKFIVYGFIGGYDEGNGRGYDTAACNGSSILGSYSSPSLLSTSVSSSTDNHFRESISLIAQCIRRASFENDILHNSGQKEEDVADAINSNDKSDNFDLPPFLLRPRRWNKSQIRNNNRSSTNSSPDDEDEDVILKLLSLSVQVLRCPAGRHLLSPADIIGVFDTCLYVFIVAQRGKRSLLRSAAADALGHCVIVVFGMRGRLLANNKSRHAQGGVNIVDQADDVGGSDSDDDWGERDPTTDDIQINDVMLFARTNIAKSMSNDDDSGLNRNSGDVVGVSAIDLDGDEINTDEEQQQQQDEEEPAFVAIMHRLATLADPLLHDDDTCQLGLGLVNIALETMSDADDLSVGYPRLLHVMQNNLCRNLLRLSTSNDLICMGLTLRVIFNLFNTIKDHLKVQLEVFLTSVHLRILTPSMNPNSKEKVWSSSPEQREIALESLLEFCREPHLMADLYMNYDCDINCTNLFETICSTLSKVANPDNERVGQAASDIERNEAEILLDNIDDGELWQKPRLNILNRLALEGLLAVIDGIARRCRASPKFEGSTHEISPLLADPNSGNSSLMGDLVSLNDGSYTYDSTNDPSEYDFCSISTTSAHILERTESDDINWLSNARMHTSLALRERKLHKRRIAKAVVYFNERSKDKEWIEEAQRLGILPAHVTPSSIATFFYTTPNLDKVKVGLYLSKGPKEIHPFHANVLKCFASLFDFRGMSFSEALRVFLGSFRLPGEAQCIDRLMEAFAVRLYEVQLSEIPALNPNQTVEDTMLDPPRRSNSDSEFNGTLDPPASMDEFVEPMLPFKSSDAAFIMSFSTIMLNTDLHNPNMDDKKRMTCEQFVRNNRGINDGEDLPIHFLTSLYEEIKNNEIQVKQDAGVGGADAFDGLLAKTEVATPFFTSSHSAHSKLVLAGVNERDMYTSISSAVFNAISTLFVKSWDDVLVTKALDGLKNSAYICGYFGLNEEFNRILETLLGFGFDYIGSVNSLMSADDQQHFPPLPKHFLSVLSSDTARTEKTHTLLIEMTGSAAHRGLLSLHCALTLSKQYLSLVNESWPMLLDVIFALRDVSALPSLFSDLDDFADSRGNPLPVSVFANRSRHRVNEYIEAIDATSDKTQQKSSGLLSIFGFGQSPPRLDKRLHDSNTQQLSPLTDVLQKVVHFAEFDRIIMKTNDAAKAKRILTELLDAMFPSRNIDELTSDPLFEHNSVFVLELAARLLISNRVHATDLYPLFFAKFQRLFTHLDSNDASSESSIIGLKFPYILERVVVTILRACIHLFDMPEAGLRGQLNQSLNLIATLPPSYTSAISDRIGCGAAIILRSRFYLFDDNTDDWSTIKCLLDLAASNKSGRGFVFDGIAAVIDSIDYALPSTNGATEQHVNKDENNVDVQLSQYGVEVMASLLLKYMNGSYGEDGDLSYKVPSMTCIRKVYSFSQHFVDKTNSENVDDRNNCTYLQENDFEIMVNAIYNDACLSEDGSTSKKGFEALQGIVISTRVNSLHVAKWFTFLRMVVSNPPSIEVDTSHEGRMSHLSLLSRLFLTLMPELSNEKENWSELEELTISVATIVSDNLRYGRKTPLFETTVQMVTNVVNVMTMPGFKVGEGVNFCAWVGETLLYELEKVGASGGANIAIVSARGMNPNEGLVVHRDRAYT